MRGENNSKQSDEIQAIMPRHSFIVLCFTCGAQIKAKLRLEESLYCKHGSNTLQKMEADSDWLNMRKIKECGSVLCSYLWGGVICDDTENGHRAD